MLLDPNSSMGLGLYSGSITLTSKNLDKLRPNLASLAQETHFVNICVI